jgi:hypothetical protein
MLHFPDGFDVMDGATFPTIPQPPTPPSGPMTPMQRFTELQHILPTHLSPNFGFIQPSLAVGRNVSLPTIRKVGSHQVEFNVRQVKHKSSEAADPLYVVFESYDQGHSFHVEYRLLAANTPEPVTGKLHVIVEKV